MSIRKLKRGKNRQKGTDPRAAQDLFNIANGYKAAGQLEKAAKNYRLAIEKDPAFGEAFNNLGSTLHQLGKLAEAIECYRRAAELLPRSTEVLLNYGTTLCEDGQAGEAIRVLEKVVALEPENAEAYGSLGVACQNAGDLPEAEAFLEKALDLRPDCLEARRVLGLVKKDRGDLEGARSQLALALEHHPEDAFSRYLLSRYKKYRATDCPEIEAIHKLLDSAGTSTKDRIFLHFALGKIYDDLGRFEEAFGHYHQANQIKRGTFNQARISTGIDLGRIRRVFTRELFGRFEGHGSASELPVFIVGMPRSGTTLVEQICASHSAVHGAGELKMIREVIDNTFRSQAGALRSQAGAWERGSYVPKLPLGNEGDEGERGMAEGLAPKLLLGSLGSRKQGRAHPKAGVRSHTGGKLDYPECLAEMAPLELRGIAEEYVSKLRGGLPAAITRVADKMPTNFIELGLIRILFPRARIIHCLRDPLDTCLSNYFQYFSEGNECSFELEELALYYRKYQALMAFWRDTLPGEILEVRYEELVSDLASQAKRLLAFLGLGWEESCLEFFRTRRPVHTSSDWQVRQPIYAKSVNRWRNYEPYIGALKKALEGESRLV